MRNLDCVSCNRSVRNVGDYALAVLCSECVHTDEGWEAYNEWKHRTGWNFPKEVRRRQQRKPKDKADAMIDALEKQIKALGGEV